MPTTPSRPTAPTWTIHSLAVRTDDGLQRLDRAYRYLLDHFTPARPTAPSYLLDHSTPARPTALDPSDTVLPLPS